ncbi:MAG TPA: DUF2252 domain-containing protein [Thermoplasmata archaeon]|nr:DUF2252 domain-containing protein [Thermoplasmata archaeon]
MGPRRHEPQALLDRPSREERYRSGKALRAKIPRSSHASWNPPRDRPDPIGLLETSNAPRVSHLVPIRYGRMSLSPFAFLRGSANVMARDLAFTPRTGFRVQLGGDAHLSNFGIFGTPERNEVFDLNDFDETLPGPWEWDVKRLATSLVLAARRNGFTRSHGRRAALRAVQSYRESMNSYAFRGYLDIWYSHLDPALVARQGMRQASRVIGRYARKARSRTSLQAFPRLVGRVGGGYRIRDQPPLIVHYSDQRVEELSHELFARYLPTLPEERRMLLEHYHLVDVAQKVVGVGSVGTRCSIILLVGDRDTDDPLILQVKQALASALEPYAGPSIYTDHAQRVVVGQHLIQQSSDSFLGWGSIRSRDYYVRQLRDWKYSAEPSSMGPKRLIGHGELCGAALARAHARTGDPAAISGYLGTKDTFDRAVAAFAEAYADQSERDYNELLTAIQKGHIHAEVDV